MIKPENLESDLKNLLFGRKALSWYKQEEKAIIARIDWILKHNPQAVGPTMQDGGVRIDCLQDVLNHRHIASSGLRFWIFPSPDRKKSEKNGI